MTRRNAELIDFRSRAEGRGSEEIRIGAYARAQRRRRIWFGAFGLAMMLVALIVYLSLRPARSSASEPLMSLKCAACGVVSQEHVAPADLFPRQCAACGRKAVRTLWTCRQCNETFLPSATAGAIRCPKCRSDDVGSASAASRPAE